MNHIELFAGCGGLSLGLHVENFELLLANEISPMAAESFAFNFFNEDLFSLAEENKHPEKTLWLKSRYKDLTSRLRENPLSLLSEEETFYSDLPRDSEELRGKLLIGSIVDLNKAISKNNQLKACLSSGFNSPRGLDLVSGGPPCQSFSMAGLRNKNCEKNALPWEFAKFVSLTKPKIAMLENVSGILRAFKDERGYRYYAWYEVAKAFAVIGYVPICLHINARLAGVAQNRPRFIMFAVRRDCFNKLLCTFCPNSASHKVLMLSNRFYQNISEIGPSLEFGYLDYLDVSKSEHRSLFENSFLSPLVSGKPVSVREALDDLRFNSDKLPSDYINNLNSIFEWLPTREHIENHDPRANKEIVRRRFRLYQILQKINDRFVTKDIFSILKGKSSELGERTWELCRSHELLMENGQLSKLSSKKALVSYLKAHTTKKQIQRALIADKPAPAALSIPDDACHYDEAELRVLTVREMARIQSFPDNFVFRSKVTTGGQMRKFQVPQYTQVGNAVPPLLSIKLGECLSTLLSKL